MLRSSAGRPATRRLRLLGCVIFFVATLGIQAANQAGESGDETCTDGNCGEDAALRCEVEQGVDYPADAVQGDIRWEHNVDSADRCCDLCKETPACKYWTLHPERKICWLKKKTVKPYRKMNDAVISGKVIKKKSKKVDGGTEALSEGSTVEEDAKKQEAEASAKKERKKEEEKEKEKQKEEKKKSDEKKKKKKQPPNNAGAPPPQRDPARAKAAFSRGHGLYKAGKHGDAIPHLEEASAFDGRDGNIDMYLGMCYENQGQWENAVRAYEGAIVKGGLTGNNKGMVHNNLGLLYRDRQHRHDDAERQYRASIAAGEAAGYGDSFFYPHKNLARLYEKNGRAEEAQKHLDIVADMNDDDAIRFYSALLLPYVYQDDADVAKWRASFRSNIKALATRQAPVPVAGIGLVVGSLSLLFLCVYACCLSRRWKRAVQKQPLWLLALVPCAMVAVPAGLFQLLAQKGIRIEDPFKMEGVPQYYLSYHGHNDAAINAEISKLFRASTPSVAFTAPHIASYTPPVGRKVRVGFFSYYFRDHSVAKMIMGLFEGLDKNQVHSVLINIGKEDHITSKLRSYTSSYLNVFGQPLRKVQQMIADEKLDVLVIAEIGMDPHAYAVAHARLAPVQLAMHGHASTTGIDSLDYYISYEGFSEPDAQSHYSERLVVLPGLTPLTRYYDLVGFPISESMYTPSGVAAYKQRFKIPADKTVYACLQTIFKVSHKLDYVARQILRGDDNAIVLMKELPMTDQVGKLVMARMRQTLTEKELKRIVFLPPLSDKDYPDSFRVVDVIFDSFPFGGHTSTLDAFSAGVPVVTWPTELMSGRCSQGLYHFIGLPELIAHDLDEYIAITLKVGKDKEYREQLSAKITEGLAKIKQDRTSIKAWNTFLQEVVHGEHRVAHWLAPTAAS